MPKTVPAFKELRVQQRCPDAHPNKNKTGQCVMRAGAPGGEHSLPEGSSGIWEPQHQGLEGRGACRGSRPGGCSLEAGAGVWHVAWAVTRAPGDGVEDKGGRGFLMPS